MSAIYSRDHDAVQTALYWLLQTEFAGVFPIELLEKIHPHELDFVVRCCEQARSITEETIRNIEDDTEKSYVWKYARKGPCPYGEMYINPEGGNAYHSHNQTDKAIFRCMEVAIKLWKEGRKIGD